MTENEIREILEPELAEKLAVLESLGIDIPGVRKLKDNAYHISIAGWSITSFSNVTDAYNCLTAMIETADYMKQCQESYPNRLKNWEPLEYSNS